MKETMCMMLAIFAGLGVVMLAGALIEGGLSAPRVRRHTSPAVGFSKKSGSLRAA